MQAEMEMEYKRPAQPIARGQHCLRHSAMLPVEIFAMRKRLLPLPLAGKTETEC